MDFLDPKKQQRNNRQLLLGYALVGIALIITIIIMVELFFGYGYKNGQVVQYGFVFFSSTPNPASIYLDGKLTKNTNTRLQLSEGTYNAKLQRTGYRPWQRSVDVLGGTVQRFDYPLLFPTQLATKVAKTYPAHTGLSTQSPDRHWLLLEDTTQPDTFNEHDLNNPKNPTTSIVIPGTVLTKTATTDSFKVVEWSTDNRHVLLLHLFGSGSEYIMLDRQTPDSSVNLTTALTLTATDAVSLQNKAYNQYFVLDSSTQTLSTASISDPALVTYADHVLAFKSYGTDTVLYATANTATPNKATIVLKQNSTAQTIREISAAPPYLLDLTKYSGDLYVAAGDSGDGKVYIFKNPVVHTGTALVPTAVLRAQQADYLSFSDSARFIVLEKANQFAVFDALTAKQYNYVSTQPIDAPQPHADWMDGDRLEYVSGGKLVVFDYDYTNVQTLVPANPNDPVFFDRNYKFLYTLAPSKAAAAEDLTDTSLLIPTDQ
jgi:hypothetical protein